MEEEEEHVIRKKDVWKKIYIGKHSSGSQRTEKMTRVQLEVLRSRERERMGWKVFRAGFVAEGESEGVQGFILWFIDCKKDGDKV